MSIQDTDALLAAAMITLVQRRLVDAAETASAAKDCADAGSVHEAVSLVIALTQPLSEATTLVSAATLMRRLSIADR
jgi:hypothetical protein